MKFLESVIGKDNRFWKYLVVAIVSFLAANTIGALPLVFVVFIFAFKQGGEIQPEAFNNLDFTGIGISENLSLLLMLIPFAVGLFTAILLIKALHKRSFANTVNGRAKVRWNRVFWGFAIWSLLMLVEFAISYAIDPGNLTFQFNIKTFIPLLFISIFLIPLQTTYEELFFRGYLAQGVAAWTKNRWMVVLIPSVLFGLMHYANPEVAEYGFWATLPIYILFGLIFGLISVLDDGIELAIGIHAANNIFASTLITFDASVLKTNALFKAHEINVQADIISLLITGLIVIFIFTKKYKWDFSVLNKKIERSE